MKSTILNLFLIGFATVTLISCDGEDIFGGGSEAEAALSEAYVNAEAAANTIYAYVDLSLRDSTLTGPQDTSTIQGATVYIEASGDYVVDFGNGVVGTDGVTRKGSIIFSASDKVITTGATVSATLSNYSRDDKPVQGALTLTVKSANMSTQEVTVGVQILNFNFNNEFTFSADKDLTWNFGYFTFFDTSDDSYRLSGTASGTDVATGNAITTTINPASALLYDRSCQYGMVSGIIDITLTGDSLDYTGGNIDFLESDSCNNVVMITLENSETQQSITIPKQFDNF